MFFLKFQLRFCEDLKEESVICEFFVVRFEMLVLWVFYKSVCSWENSVMAYVTPLRNISQKQGSWQKVLRTSLNLGELPPPIIPFGLLLYASVRQATADISCDKQCDKTCSHATWTQTYQFTNMFFLSVWRPLFCLEMNIKLPKLYRSCYDEEKEIIWPTSQKKVDMPSHLLCLVGIIICFGLFNLLYSVQRATGH